MLIERMFCAVFDLDGTLADTSGDLLDAANAQFEALGYKAPLDAKDRNTALHGGRAMLSLGAERLGIEDVQEFANAQYQNFIAHYEKNLSVKTKLYENAEVTVRTLREAGWKTAICTNKPAYLAEELLQALGVRGSFDSLVGVGTIEERKPDPRPLFEAIERAGGNPMKSFLIGDSTTDYETGKNSDIPVLLVDFDGTGIGDKHPDAPVVQEFATIGEFAFFWQDSLKG